MMNIVFNIDKIKNTILKKLKISKDTLYIPEDVNYRYVIAITPEGEKIISKCDSNYKTHEELIETELMIKLNDYGYKINGPINVSGVMGGYPYAVPFIRECSLAFIIGANINKHPQGGIDIYAIPETITKEQYDALTVLNTHHSSYLHDTTDDFVEIDEISKNYVTNKER